MLVFPIKTAKPSKTEFARHTKQRRQFSAVSQAKPTEMFSIYEVNHQIAFGV